MATASLADYQAFTYTDPAGHVMPYRLFVPPDYDPHRKYPLVVWLHGSGEVGTNNTGPASHVVAARLAAHAKDPEYSSLVLVPQTYDYWGERAQGDVLDIMALLEDQYSIDTNREYLSGISLGGYGVWDFIAQYPDKFAAAVPVAGGGDPGSAETIKDIPIWNYHSRADEVVSVSQSQVMIDALRAAGGHPRYTEYPFGTHGSSFNDTYSEPQLYQWMYSQTAVPEPGAGLSVGLLALLALLRWPRKSGSANRRLGDIHSPESLCGRIVEFYAISGHNRCPSLQRFGDAYCGHTRTPSHCPEKAKGKQSTQIPASTTPTEHKSRR